VSEATHNHLVAHQFEQPEQQAEAVTLGMWAFLITEILFFGALFVAYAIYRWTYHEAWIEGSHHLDRSLGMLNTGILLVSSLTMALGVHAAQESRRKPLMVYLVLTILLALGFVVVKTIEYGHKWEDNLVPGRHFMQGAGHAPGAGTGHATAPPGEAVRSDVAAVPPADTSHPRQERPMLTREGVGPNMDDRTRQLQLFYMLYFCMTGLHAIHVIIGVGALSVLLYLAWKGWFSRDYYSPVEMTGLYWHFVDIVWVFLFPLLYLITE
jgi:cytochrome c oxidase subunit 3